MKLINKAGLLLFLLAIPVFIYIFLQFYGENYYSIPVYYEDGIPNSLNLCPPTSTQHFVSQDPLTAFDITLQDHITVMSFLASDCGADCQQKFNHLSRVHNVFVEQIPLQIVSFLYDQNGSQSLLPNDGSQNKNWHIVRDFSDLQNWADCELLISQDSLIEQEEIYHQFVLLDRKRRIRGYYNALDIEDIDRLVLEIRILQYEFEHAI